MSRRFQQPAAGLALVLWLLGGAASASARRVVIGHSVQGRPIVAWSFGPERASRKILASVWRSFQPTTPFCWTRGRNSQRVIP